MTKRFSELEKEQFNANLPTDLTAKIRARADYKGWSIARATTEALAIGLGVSPSEYGIEPQESIR